MLLSADAGLTLQSPCQRTVAKLVAGGFAHLLGLQNLDGESIGWRPSRNGQIAGQDEAGRHLVGVLGHVVDVGVDSVRVAQQ